MSRASSTADASGWVFVPRAYALLTIAMTRRILRETQVIRAMLFPLILTTGTLVATLGGVAFVRTPGVIAVPLGFDDPELVRILAVYDMSVRQFDDPRAAALAGNARAATDGTTIYTRGPTTEAMLIESVFRARHPEAWQITPLVALPDAEEQPGVRLAVARLLVAVFALNAVVLGAAVVARDRDEGTLSVEMALPLPRWLHGATRWSATTLVLSAFVIASLASVDAMLGVPELGDTLRNALAACAASTAIGLGAVGRAGLKNGFAPALAGGLAFAFGLVVLGRFVPVVAPWLPIASLAASGSGYVPMVMSIGFAVVAIWRFGRADLE